MAFQLRFLPNEPIVIIEHRGDRSYSLNSRARLTLRSGLRNYLSASSGLTWVLVDFSKAGWAFAEQAVAIENLSSHFEDMGGLDFLVERIQLVMIGESEVPEVMAAALEKEPFNRLKMLRFHTQEEALAHARGQSRQEQG